MASSFQKRFAHRISKTTTTGAYARLGDGKVVGKQQVASNANENRESTNPAKNISAGAQQPRRRKFSVEDIDFLQHQDEIGALHSSHNRKTTRKKEKRCSSKKERNFAFQKIGMDAVTTDVAHNRDPESFYKEKRKTRDEINEGRVKTKKDHLHFSRKARHVDYTPYTLDEYKKKDTKDYQELGKLPADLSREDLVVKRKNKQRVKEYAANLRVLNAASRTNRGPHKREVEAERQKRLAEKKKNSARQKAIEFAKRSIPRPRRTDPEKSRTEAIKRAKQKQERKTWREMDAAGMGVGGTFDLGRDSDPDSLFRRVVVGTNEEIEEERRRISKLEKLELQHDEARRDIEAIRKEYGL